MLRIYTSYEANVFVKVSFIAHSFQLNCLMTSYKLSLGELIRPKRIYFLEHFCYCFSSNLSNLDTTNTD